MIHGNVPRRSADVPTPGLERRIGWHSHLLQVASDDGVPDVSVHGIFLSLSHISESHVHRAEKEKILYNQGRLPGTVKVISSLLLKKCKDPTMNNVLPQKYREIQEKLAPLGMMKLMFYVCCLTIYRMLEKRKYRSFLQLLLSQTYIYPRPNPNTLAINAKIRK